MEHPPPEGFGPDRCAAYLAGTEGAPPRSQLLDALKQVVRQQDPRALDVGCGPGRELVVLLREGFEVVGIDCSAQMIDLSRSRVAAEIPARMAKLRLECSTLEHAAERLVPHEFLLVHAGFVLPFIPRAHFDRSVDRLLTSIAPGGCFSGQFFGPNDEFVRTSRPEAMTSHGAHEVRALFDGFEIILHEEVDRQGAVGRGVPKWWHVHHVIARKRPA